MNFTDFYFIFTYLIMFNTINCFIYFSNYYLFIYYKKLYVQKMYSNLRFQMHMYSNLAIDRST